MCLIFLKPKGAKNYLTKERFDNAITNNPHAVGVVYRTDDGKIEIQRFVKPSTNKDAIYDIIKDKEEFAIHFRYATHGILNLTNTHPFIVTKGLCMMHNGVMSEFGDLNKDWSDTKNFVEYFLKPYIEEEGIGVVQDPEFKADLEKVIGSGNKLLFIDKDFNYSIINEKAGTWKEGCWLSNTYSVEPPYSSYYKSYAPKDGTAKTTSKYDYWDDYKSYYDTPWDDDKWEYDLGYDSISDIEKDIAADIRTGYITGSDIIPYELEIDNEYIKTNAITSDELYKIYDEIASNIEKGIYKGNIPCQWELIINQKDIDALLNKSSPDKTIELDAEYKDIVSNDKDVKSVSRAEIVKNLTEAEKEMLILINAEELIYEDGLDAKKIALLDSLVKKGIISKEKTYSSVDKKLHTFYYIKE